MSLASLLSLPHADLLTALSYSPSSTHLVTASADHTLALFRRGAGNGSSWTKVDRWKAHDGPVGGVGWAQDEWGVMVGSWGWDRKVAIWREDVEQKRNSGRRMPLLWSTVLPPSVGLPSSLAFPPLALSTHNNAQGLLLACLTDRGYLVVWTPSGGGGGAGLNDWFELARCDLVRAATTISGDAPSSSSTPAAAGGQLGKMLGGSSSHLHANANATGSGSSGGGRPSPSSTTTTSGLVAPSTMTAGGGGAGAGKAVRRLSWCREAWWGLVFACALDSTGAIHIMTLQTPSSPPLLLVTLPSPSPFVTSAAGGAPPTGSFSTTTPYPSSSSKNVSSPTTTAAGAGGGGGGAAGLATQLALDWAPSCGRSYHLIASGDRAGVIRIWRVVPAGLEADEDEEEEEDDDDDDDDEGGEGGGAGGSKRRTARGEWTARCVAELADHGAPVTQLQWNATGTLLSSSADDGTTRLFKATYANRWECAAVFDAESPPPAAEDAGEGGDAEMA